MTTCNISKYLPVGEICKSLRGNVKANVAQVRKLSIQVSSFCLRTKTGLDFANRSISFFST